MYAMLSTDNYEWHPICENYKQLKQYIDVNNPSQQLKVTLKNGQQHMIPQYFTLQQKNCKIFNLNEKAFEILLPSVIRKITIANTRQYFHTIMRFSKDTITRAAAIPHEITKHVYNLQDRLTYGLENSFTLPNMNINQNHHYNYDNFSFDDKSNCVHN